MTTEPDQEQTIECGEFYNLMQEYRNADFVNKNPHYAYKDVIAFVDARSNNMPAPITLRDQFAMAALNALIAKEYKDDVKRGAKGVPIFAQYSYEYADAMMEARKK